MKNIKYIFTIAFFSILLSCKTTTDCLSPNNDCNCQDGYEGENCGIKVTDKFLGKFIPESSSSISSNSMAVTDTLSEIRRVNFKKFNFFNDYIGDFYGIVDGEHITVPLQKTTNANVPFKEVQGEVCLIKTSNNVSLIMRLTFNGSSQSLYRIVYIKT
jgi:hypothetical protein